MASVPSKGSKSDGKKKGETRELQPLKVTTNDDPTQMSGTPSTVTSFHREQSPSNSEMASTPTDESQADGHDEGDGETTQASGGKAETKKQLKKKEQQAEKARKAKEKEDKKVQKREKERQKEEDEKNRKEREKQERKERKQEKYAEKQHSRGGSIFRHKKKNQDTQPPVAFHGDGQAQQIPSDDHAPSDATPEVGVSVSDKKETTHDEGSEDKPQDTQGVSALM